MCKDLEFRGEITLEIELKSRSVVLHPEWREIGMLSDGYEEKEGPEKDKDSLSMGRSRVNNRGQIRTPEAKSSPSVNTKDERVDENVR